MSVRFGVSVCHYGGLSWKLAELQRELVRQGVPILDLKGSPYPEMSRAEQVRRARIGAVEVVVLMDSHVTATVAQLEELVSVASAHGMATVKDPGGPWALECAAVRRDVLEAMVSQEERVYGNSAVDVVWGGEKVPAVPIASPWQRNGSSLVPGHYLTDGEAFVLRARRAGAVVAQHGPEGLVAERGPMRARAANVDKPITSDAGSQFALCVPSFGALDHDQQNAIAELERIGMVVFGLHDCPWIDQARSWLTERALSVGRGVFFLDHDIIFSANDVLWHCQHALERNAVVAAAYCMRHSGKNIIGSLDVKPGPMKFFKGGGIVPAFYSGLGFAAIPRSVLEDIELPALTSLALARGIGWGEKIRPWYALDCSTGFYAGEDVSFCNRVHDLTVQMKERDAGFEPEWEMTHSGRPARVFIDTRTRIMHRGSYDYGIEDAGIVVPRIEEMETVLCGSRKEAREILVNALELPVDVKLGMQEFAAP